MTYRRTAKYSAQRVESMSKGKERAAMSRPIPEYHPILPELRIRITVQRYDLDVLGLHVFELHRCNRIDRFAVFVDGKPWKTCGMSKVLEGIRKATPRLPSPRSVT